MSQQVPSPALREVLKQNNLFSDFSEHQLDAILSIAEEITINKGDFLIEENEVSDHIYIIIKGKVEVCKREGNSNQLHRLATLEANTVIGEMALISDSLRSASVRALESTTLVALSVRNLRSVSDDRTGYSKINKKIKELEHDMREVLTNPPFFSLLIQNLAKVLGQRIRNTNDAVVDALRKELAQAKVQVAMGIMIVNVIAMIAFYMITIKILNDLHFEAATTTIVSIPLIVVLALFSFYIILKSGYPLAVYGITTKYWRISIIESLLLTTALILVTIVIKYIALHVLRSYETRSIFDGKLFATQFSYETRVVILVVYFLFVPLQELIVRGMLQSSFQEFLIGPHKLFFAILMSNLLFSLTHLHLSLEIALFVFLIGLSWGWLYSRHRTLVGVILSHMIIGVWALFVLGP